MLLHIHTFQLEFKAQPTRDCSTAKETSVGGKSLDAKDDFADPLGGGDDDDVSQAAH